MKAIVYERYGSPDRLEVRNVATPTVKPDGVLVRVHASSVSRSDWEVLTARPAYVRASGAGFWKPKNQILGSDVAGTVEAVGEDVAGFRPGDEVLADTMRFGAAAFAEYAAVPERAPLVPKPPDLSFEDAATLPQAALLALQGLRVGRPIEPGDDVLIIGAGGGGGTFAIQIAKSRGARVTGVDNGLKQEMMRSIGADEVIDYTRDDFAKGDQRYDRILDFAGRRSFIASRRLLKRDGVYAMVGGSVPRIFQVVVVGSLLTMMGSKHTKLLVAKPNKEDLTQVAELAAEGLIKPVIHQRYELGQVPDALRALGEGRVLGKAVVGI